MSKWCSAALLLLTACGSTLGDARDAFSRGHYSEAKQKLLTIADEYPQWDSPRQARFALYLGLTYAELGDTVEARRWLLTAKAMEDDHRGTLTQDDWHRLELGLAALEPMDLP